MSPRMLNKHAGEQPPRSRWSSSRLLRSDHHLPVKVVSFHTRETTLAIGLMVHVCRVKTGLGGKKLSLVLDTVGGASVGELAKSLKSGGPIVVYAMQSGQFPAISPKDFIYRGLSVHGFWLINWIHNAPRTEIEEIYQKLGDLVADGSLSAAVEHVYPLDQFKEAFKQSLKSNRSGKILFKF